MIKNKVTMGIAMQTSAQGYHHKGRRPSFASICTRTFSSTLSTNNGENKGIFFVIVLARCAAIADGIFVSEDLADNVIEALISFKALLRDFVAISLQGEVRELQLIGVIERILCAEVVFAALIGEVFFVCIHVFNVSELW
jgi:hypothetical protein